MELKYLALAAALAGSLAGAAHAGQIGVGDFTSPVTTAFGGPDPTSVVSEPLSIANYTFTTPSTTGLIWWGPGNPFNDCVGGCVTTTTDTAGADGYGLNVDLGGGFALAGLYVGQATAYSLDVSFFDASHTLLGTVNVSGAGDGVTFAGWESDIDKVASIQVLTPTSDNFVVSAQSGLLQAIGGAAPEPASWAMMIAGFGLAGAMLRRRAGRSAAAA
jgi:hypothetical protein